MKKFREQTSYKVEISNGELLDKVSILELKLLKIKDKNKLKNIQNEFDTINPLVVDLFETYDSDLQIKYLELSKINGQLWDIEDDIRECERNKDFGKKFVELARSVYITNDERCRVKKEINLLTNSDLVEEKSYEEY
jgi:hypothetical protein|tara:strand:- start:56 stop:466 length:411 start_codon:yes stop_codon:yes gene_type:complete